MGKRSDGRKHILWLSTYPAMHGGAGDNQQKEGSTKASRFKSSRTFSMPSLEIFCTRVQVAPHQYVDAFKIQYGTPGEDVRVFRASKYSCEPVPDAICEARNFACPASSPSEPNAMS
jgi:hypothetical protein